VVDEQEPMGPYPERRRVVLTWADSMGLTVLEQARACVLAGVGQRDAGRLQRAIIDDSASPEDVLQGTLLWYAIAYELELRRDPSTTWADAQAWDVKFDPAGRDQRAELLEAEAEARVTAALVTGIPPEQAGELSMADLAAYRDVRERAEREAKRRPRRKRTG
jgi:hypothetical protein